MNSSQTQVDGLKVKIKEVIERMKKDKKSLLILLIGIMGMLLILFSGDGDKEINEPKTENSNYYIEDDIQQEVTKLIENISGVGKVCVAITYECAYETVYAANSKEKYNGSDVQIDKDYIITDDETGLIVKVIYPKVRGVAIICQGGDDPIIKQKIYSIVSALFDISTNKISVADMA